MLENAEGAMKKDIPESLATQGTQDTGQINVREYRGGNEKGHPGETGNIGYTIHRTNKCQIDEKSIDDIYLPSEIVYLQFTSKHKIVYCTITCITDYVPLGH